MNETLTAYERFKIRVSGRVDAVKARCWFGHSWGRWRVTHRFKLISTGFLGRQDAADVGDGFVQERECGRCGYTQMEQQKRTIHDA